MDESIALPSAEQQHMESFNGEGQLSQYLSTILTRLDFTTQ